MKTLLKIVLIFPIITYSQNSEYNYSKPVLIDSIHTKRLCISYPGMTRYLTTKEAFEESEYVFTGRVSKIITTEQLEPHDYELDENGHSIPIDIWPTYKYWYELKTIKVYKGES